MPSLFKLKRLITFTLIMTFALSCGDAFMKKSEDKESRFEKFARCKTDTKALSNILKYNIKGDLKCLEQNLNLFMDVVKTDKPGYLSLKELKIYIKKNIDSIDESVFELLTAIFELNSLVLGDSPVYIKRGHVSSLIDLFIEINRTMVKHQVLDFYSEDQMVSFSEHNARKTEVFQALVDIGNKILEISVENKNQINFESFLSRFQSIDSSEGVRVVLNNIPKLLFIKKIFLGGDKKVLSSKELRRLAGMLQDIAKISFDLSSLGSIKFSENEVEEMLETFNVGVRSLVKNLYPSSGSEVVMNLQDVFNIAEIFTGPLDPRNPEGHISKWFKYKKEFLLLKEFLLDSNKSDFTAKEVRTLFDNIISSNLQRSVQIYQSYRINKDLLDETRLLDEGDVLERISEVADKNNEFESMMNRIVKKYFFFKGKDATAKFSRQIKRSALGVVQISLLEDVLRKVFKGKAAHTVKSLEFSVAELQEEIQVIEDDKEISRRDKKKQIKILANQMKEINEKKNSMSLGMLSGDYINQETIVSLFEDFRTLLLDNGFITRNRERNTAETITLMTSLFQGQSDGDGKISVTEMTEFAIQLMGGLETASMGQEYFSSICENVETNPEKPARFMPECFRNNFLSFMDEEKNGVQLKDQLSGLVEYMNSSEEKAQRYLKISEDFTRSCTVFKDGSEVPYTESEMMLLFTGMYSIEQTFTRYDRDGDGILNFNEVDAAYEVYKPAIEALIPSNILKGRSRDFFYYLIKYKRLPDVETKGRGVKGFFKAIKEGFKLIGFIYFKRNEKKRATADRETIATILGVLSELSPEKKKNPFPCHTLSLDYVDEESTESQEAREVITQ